MGTIGRDKIEIPVSASLKRQFEDAARDLHLTPEAYLAYLMERVAPGIETARLDKHVQEVFGKHGELVRRLAK